MKVNIEIEQAEAQAFVEVLKDAKMPAEMGYVLTSLKFKIFQAFKKADESVQLETAKKMLTPGEEKEHNKGCECASCETKKAKK